MVLRVRNVVPVGPTRRRFLGWLAVLLPAMGALGPSRRPWGRPLAEAGVREAEYYRHGG
jgi:hypothetical protein